ncbi:MAG: hypothetical protein ABSE97_08615 [Verrucomicrobiota bacterium]|jgi:phosphate/sulfate permease
MDFISQTENQFHTSLWVVALVNITVAVIHIAFACGVYADTRKLQQNGKRIYLVHPLFWVLATILGGVISAGIYWLVHHLRLRQDEVDT